MRNSSLRRQAGFTLVDLVMVLCMSALLLTIYLFIKPPPNRRHVGHTRIRCVNNLRQVGLAYRIWSNEHEERFPWELAQAKGGIVPNAGQVGRDYGELAHAFLALSNELTVPNVLVCPSDQKMKADGFDVTASIPFGGSGLRNSSSNLSYLAGWDANETLPQTILVGDPNFVDALPTGDGDAGVSGKAKSFSIAQAGRTSVVEKGVKWNTALHNGVGNLGLSDGSAHQVSTPQLNTMLASAVTATNRLRARVVVPQP